MVYADLNLNGDTISWLLEPENPSVRYWTLIDLLDRDEDDPEILETRKEISSQPLVKELFRLQHPDGHWGADPAKPYTAEGAMMALALLFLHGVKPDERTLAGCDSFLQYSQNACGGFSLTRTIRSGIFPCTTGEHLPMLVYFGLASDPRVEAAFQFLVADMAREDALDCGRYQHRDCLWGAIAALKGLAVLPSELQSDDSRLVVENLSNRLLDGPYDFEGEHKRWLTLGVPRLWDLLGALRVLAEHGYGGDARFKLLLNRLLALQDERGRWKCGSISRTWPLEKRGQPSKWVTLDMLRVLKKTDKFTAAEFQTLI